MRTESPPLIRLEDYRPSAFLIDRVDLDIRLDPHATRITAELALRPNPAGAPEAPLHLDGDDLSLIALDLDGAGVPPGDVTVTPAGLTLHGRPGGPSCCGSSPRSIRPPTPS